MVRIPISWNDIKIGDMIEMHTPENVDTFFVRGKRIGTIKGIHKCASCIYPHGTDCHRTYFSGDFAGGYTGACTPFGRMYWRLNERTDDICQINKVMEI